MISNEVGFSIYTKSDSLGNYAIQFSSVININRYILEVMAEDHMSDVRKIEFKSSNSSRCDFDLMPSIICIDTWFPEHFIFTTNSGALQHDDSLYIVMRFSNPEIKKILQSYSYNIITRRSTYESDQIALERGNSIRLLLTQMGLDSTRISVENRSTRDFFYCTHCEGCIFEYLSGQGVTITQELIDQSSDPITKEKFESMRRIAQIEMRKLE